MSAVRHRVVLGGADPIAPERLSPHGLSEPMSTGGEGSPKMRSEICARPERLRVRLDAVTNAASAYLIIAETGRAEAPTRQIDEEAIIVRAVWALVGEPAK